MPEKGHHRNWIVIYSPPEDFIKMESSFRKFNTWDMHPTFLMYTIIITGNPLNIIERVSRMKEQLYMHRNILMRKCWWLLITHTCSRTQTTNVGADWAYVIYPNLFFLCCRSTIICQQHNNMKKKLKKKYKSLKLVEKRKFSMSGWINVGKATAGTFQPPLSYPPLFPFIYIYIYSI